MKLLVIGGTGLLSGAVVREALNKDIEVTIVNRGIKSKVMPQGAKVITADFRNETMMKSALQDLYFDAAIDFICFNKEQMEYSVKLLSQHCDQYIYISSACVYNYALPGVKTEDSEKVFEKWSYSVNKWAGECCLTELAKELKVNYTIIRPCITYDDSRIPYGMTPPYGYHWTLVGRILAGKPIIRWNGGTTKWSMMRVEDFVVGLVGVVGNKDAYNQAYNISGDNAYSWNDVIECVEDAINKKAIFYDLTSEEYTILSNDKEGRIYGRSSDLICSNQKIKDLVPEFKTTYNLQDGIMKTIAGYQNEKFERGIDYAFDAYLDRTILKSCKEHGIKSSNYKLGFVDYLGNSTNKEKLRYYAIRSNIRIVNTKFGIPLIVFGSFPYKDVLVKCIPKSIR
jgi:nucleoside-diphosphate-sugar epimerase